MNGRSAKEIAMARGKPRKLKTNVTGAERWTGCPPMRGPTFKVTQRRHMSLSAKREALASIHGRHEHTGRACATRILTELCTSCGYYLKVVLANWLAPHCSPDRLRQSSSSSFRPRSYHELWSGSVEADSLAHCDNSMEGDDLHSLTFTELFVNQRSLGGLSPLAFSGEANRSAVTFCNLV